MTATLELNPKPRTLNPEPSRTIERYIAPWNAIAAMTDAQQLAASIAFTSEYLDRLRRQLLIVNGADPQAIDDARIEHIASAYEGCDGVAGIEDPDAQVEHAERWDMD